MTQSKRKVFKKDVRLQVWNKYGQRCVYCGIELEYKDMQVDHLQPISFEPTREHIDNRHHLSNLMPSCRSCNFYKSSLPLELFRNEVSLAHQRLTTCGSKFLVNLALRYGIVKITPFDGLFYFEREEQADE